METSSCGGEELFVGVCDEADGAGVGKGGGGCGVEEWCE